MQFLKFDENDYLSRTVKMGSSAGLSLLVTAALILLMISLIAMQPVETREIRAPMPVITMPEDRTITEQKTQDVEKPDDPKDPPELPPVDTTYDQVDIAAVFVAPEVDPGKTQLDTAMTSGSAIPIIRVAPQYPRGPQLRGIEGFVDLMFDIGPTGKTENIRVLGAKPVGLFENASIRALRKWKYKPAFDGEVAIVQRDQTTRISFNLEN